ncbi:unnamed protein product [Cylindrotheca closterium]|uniref:Uncharacterized protein n=1 Tax=Cylindrotheca closterium TaxID=2856 RepID=A0AAD2JMG1_9STRA|nr:unnamed protein product [Cylindrotheca closterium]
MEDTTAKSNISNEDDDQSMQPPSAMLSLLDKYSRMEAQMTHVRQETTRIQLEIQARNSSAEKLSEERQGMIVEQERFSKETKILQEDAKIARQKLNSIQQEALQAKQRKEEARRNLDRLEMQSKEYRRRFFHSSQSFRNECKKRKITCQALGLTHAPLVAHAMVFQPQMFSSFHNINNPDEIQSENQDGEHSCLIKQLKALEASHSASKQRREQLKKQKDDLLSRSRDRRQRKTSLEAQLGRILKDIDMLNSRIQGEKRPTTISTQAVTNSNSTFVLPAARTTAGDASKILLNNPENRVPKALTLPQNNILIEWGVNELLGILDCLCALKTALMIRMMMIYYHLLSFASNHREFWKT